MRLQLIAVACVSLLSGTARAQLEDSGARTRAVVYQDDDATTVLTAAGEVVANVDDRVTVRAGYLLDAITTASVDVVAAASERWTERRDELRGGAAVALGDLLLSAGVVRSIENDYDSWTVEAGASVDLAQRATTLALGIGWVDSDVGRADDPGFGAEQRTWVANLRLVQALDPDTLGAVGYSLQRVKGYQASPYRYVAVGDVFVPETHPRERWRHALVGRLRHAISAEVTLGIDERLYVDDWGVMGTTTQLLVVLGLSEDLDLELRNRLHFQTAASFWRERYEQPLEHVSADRELSTFVDDYAGPALVWTGRDVGPFTELRFDVRVDAFYYRFFDYAYLDGRVGVLGSVGLGGTL